MNINCKTLEQIKKDLERCSNVSGCAKCEHLGDLGCVERNMRNALAAIKHLEAQQPKWISVKERLPEPFVSVQVHMPGERPHPTVREGYISNEGVWVAGYFRRESDEVTHWANMSEPPKEDTHG